MEKKAGATKKTGAKKTAPKKKKAVSAESATKAAKKTAPKARKAAKPCKMKGCSRAYRSKGYCKAHYKMWRHGKFGKARFKRCHDYGCNRPMALNRHGFCEEHYQNFFVKGMEQTHAPVAAPAKPDKAAEKAA
jgi:hypothetical protein